MITSGRRCYQFGSEIAGSFPHLLPEKVVHIIGRRTHDALRIAGYAHIEPKTEFVEQFVVGFVHHFSLSSLYR